MLNKIEIFMKILFLIYFIGFLISCFYHGLKFYILNLLWPLYVFDRIIQKIKERF